jgi:hypothetical protein
MLSGRRERPSLHTTLHSVGGARHWRGKSAFPHRAKWYANKGEHVNTPKGPLQCKRCQRCGHTHSNSGYAPTCVACTDAHLLGKCVAPNQQLKCCSSEGKHTANYRGCSTRKVGKAAATERERQNGWRLHICFYSKQLHRAYILNRRAWTLTEITLSKEA